MSKLSLTPARLRFTCMIFFFNDTATTEIYTLSLHDALPISYQFAVGNRDPRCGNGENRFGREPVVRVVVRRKIVARVFRFALGPDLFRAIRIILVRQNEIHSLCRLALVADRNFKAVAGFSLSTERNDQLV